MWTHFSKEIEQGKQWHNFWWKLKQSQGALKSRYFPKKIPQENACGRVLIVTLETHILQFHYKKACNKLDASSIPEAHLEIYQISAMEPFCENFCGNFVTKYTIFIWESPNVIELVDASLQKSYNKFYCFKKFIVDLVLKHLRQIWLDKETETAQHHLPRWLHTCNTTIKGSEKKIL